MVIAINVGNLHNYVPCILIRVPTYLRMGSPMFTDNLNSDNDSVIPIINVVFACLFFSNKTIQYM